MTLFDGQPLTDAEVQAREMCLCSHASGAHCDHGCDCQRACSAPLCDCKEFVWDGGTLRKETRS